ncbi:MAG TPA: tRNA (adenosine(37)-N6)-threonylcarbamoyltransferase complex transferase subunit TsaD [Candidatus Omnitrophica bacterium]|nr:tRNA (adenosine(37)-N6)-threonylcarbamoyltransferase complex transferase subunit TsaD [Candidatus Omnitrophota bacterium]HCI43950.1 tRNA (adenosine(37)-N6)-threonylcarbamoyltransferase complex transferase subunit TsaD [Candidatus Omnitrophota bacterium]
MNFLGIETSCDETAAAVVRDGRKILSNVVASSLKEHQRYGGVVPEVASRRQLEYIQPVVDEALEKAGLALADIDAFAVTKEPGLIGSLLVGVSFARALSAALDKPLVEIDHIEAHVYANFLTGEPPQLPAVALVVSGGHTDLYSVRDIRAFRRIGRTRDDAVGEAFDKVARVLGLGYPGGPVIDRLAKSVPRTDVSFKCAALEGTLDFSFSGVKTAVLYHRQKHGSRNHYPVAAVARAFQESVVEILVIKALAACRKLKVQTLLVGGGVAANSALRQHLSGEAHKKRIKVYFPAMALCMDNAAMIAGLGFHSLN